jgi:hypothetical protein
MARFVIERDVGILDRGEGAEKRFVAVEGVEVSENGALSNESRLIVASVMSQEAVKNGATRIELSDCVEVSLNNASVDDRVYAYNGGDVIYDAYENASDIRKFLIDEEILVVKKK